MKSEVMAISGLYLLEVALPFQGSPHAVHPVVHFFENPVGAGLNRQVDVVAEFCQVAEGLDQVLGKVLG
ncbi:MAG: hypothetical protein U5J82_00465 [Desulfobacterales bacterium]|nr:hypothetical protein [Desulfobacterales bacterium]